jgi:hypothetical protein
MLFKYESTNNEITLYVNLATTLSPHHDSISISTCKYLILQKLEDGGVNILKTVVLRTARRTTDCVTQTLL